jgi:hypothetical protein
MNESVAFTYMVNVLNGAKYTNHVCQLIADEIVSAIGTRGDSTQHLLLSNRLYTPTVMENFANA